MSKDEIKEKTFNHKKKHELKIKKIRIKFEDKK
jgi:hypothetical protein